MAKPSKSIMTLTGHRTKAEIAFRKEGEAATLSGVPLTERDEVKKNLTAHKEFIRVSGLLEAIGKSDDLYSTQINDYCLLFARRQNLSLLLEEMSPRDDIDVYLKVLRDIRAIERDMRSIEDKNLMNIQSALRSVPKHPTERENPLKAVLNG